MYMVNFEKFHTPLEAADRMAYAHSTDPDQTAPMSDQGLPCLPFH